MKNILFFLIEIIRIVIVLSLVYVTLGILVFKALRGEYFYLHFISSILLTFIWYRYKGQFNGWIRTFKR